MSASVGNEIFRFKREKVASEVLRGFNSVYCVIACCGLRHTLSLASILRPLPYGELPSPDLSEYRALSHV